MKYEQPELTVYLLGEEDVIRTSATLKEDFGGYPENDWDSYVG